MRLFRAFVGAAFWVALLVVLPRLAVGRLPAETLMVFGSQQKVTSTLTAVGLALAVCTLGAQLLPRHAWLNLAARVGSTAAGTYLTLFFVGLGEPLRFGSVSRALPMGPGVVLSFDFRIMVQAVLALRAAEVVLRVLEFAEASRARADALRLAGPAIKS